VHTATCLYTHTRTPSYCRYGHLSYPYLWLDRTRRSGCRPGRGDHALLVPQPLPTVADIPSRATLPDEHHYIGLLLCLCARTHQNHKPRLFDTVRRRSCAAINNKAAVHHEKRGWARVQMGWTNGRGYCSLMSTRGSRGHCQTATALVGLFFRPRPKQRFWPSLHSSRGYSWPRTASQHEMRNESTPDGCSTAHWERVLSLGWTPLPLTFDAPSAVQHQRAAGQTY
jgi:hypothetical protein